MESYTFRMVSGDLPETMQKLCLSSEFPHEEIMWNYGILLSSFINDWQDPKYAYLYA